jgi:hypothetical protein
MERLVEYWPQLVAVVLVAYHIGQQRNKIAVLEDKVRTLFDLFNRTNKRRDDT